MLVYHGIKKWNITKTSSVNCIDNVSDYASLFSFYPGTPLFLYQSDKLWCIMEALGVKNIKKSKVMFTLFIHVLDSSINTEIWFRFMVFNPTFNNISVISWWSSLFIITDLSQVNFITQKDKQCSYTGFIYYYMIEKTANCWKWG
jgi:hypothetical protein